MEEIRKGAALLAVALLASWLSGCAFIDVDLEMPKSASDGVPKLGKGRRVRVVLFEDERAIANRCGMQKNGYNMDTADAICADPPARWFSSVLKSELNRAGFVTGDRADANTVRIDGGLIKLFVEPKVGFFTFSPEADLHVRIRVTNSEGFMAERRFFVKGEQLALIGTSSTFGSALQDAVDQLMPQIVTGLAELLDEYPQLSDGQAVALLASETKGGDS